MLKGISARLFFKTFRTNRYVYRKLWARSYFAREIKEEEETKKILSYIKNQIGPTGLDKRYNKSI
jgi:REP element-mobilizing transposase RayT